MCNVLLVEHEPTLGQTLGFSLRRQGYRVIVMDIENAIKEVRRDSFDLVLLDAREPNRRGLRLLTALRKHGSSFPVIVLSAFEDPAFVVTALRAGADDFIKKPFGVMELVARMESVLKHYKKNTLVPLTVDLHETAFRYDDIEIYPQRYELCIRGERLTLRTKEFDLFFFLLKHCDKAFTVDALSEKVWIAHKVQPNSVRGYISALRQVLKAFDEYIQIQWMRQFGYKLVVGKPPKRRQALLK